MRHNKLHTLSFFFFAFWVTPGDAQGLLLALHSGITPGGAQGTIWDAGIRTRVGHMQGKRPTRCAITPAPIFFFFFPFFPFWITPSGEQGLLLALHSGITPVGAQGTIWDAGN